MKIFEGSGKRERKSQKVRRGRRELGKEAQRSAIDMRDQK